MAKYRKQSANLNKHTERGTRLLKESIERDGFIGAVTVAADGETFAGSNRIEVAGEAIDDAVVVHTHGEPVVVVRDDIATADDPKARRLGFADNAIAAADFDPDAQLLRELAATDALVAQMARDDERLRAMLKEPKQETADAGALVDKAAELQQKWAVNRGDLWEAGRHRILCGDSTNAADVARVMAGEKADLFFTSPPYNVDVQYASHDDSHKSADEYLGWLGQLCLIWSGELKDGRAFIWNIGVSARTYPHQHVGMLEQVGLTFVREYVWAKVGVPVPNWYHSRQKPIARYVKSNYTHEMVYVLAKGELEEGGETDFDDTLEHDVIHINQTEATRDIPSGATKSGAGKHINLERRALKAHPAAFPVKLPMAFIRSYTAPSELVVDSFLGAGTTLVACEQTGRVGRGVEIEPKYCAVALERLSLLGLECKRISP